MQRTKLPFLVWYAALKLGKMADGHQVESQLDLAEIMTSLGPLGPLRATSTSAKCLTRTLEEYAQ